MKFRSDNGSSKSQSIKANTNPKAKNGTIEAMVVLHQFYAFAGIRSRVTADSDL